MQVIVGINVRLFKYKFISTHFPSTGVWNDTQVTSKHAYYRSWAQK